MISKGYMTWCGLKQCTYHCDATSERGGTLSFRKITHMLGGKLCTISNLLFLGMFINQNGLLKGILFFFFFFFFKNFSPFKKKKCLIYVPVRLSVRFSYLYPSIYVTFSIAVHLLPPKKKHGDSDKRLLMPSCIYMM